jgi:hypothetical protein
MRTKKKENPNLDLSKLDINKERFQLDFESIFPEFKFFSGPDFLEQLKNIIVDATDPKKKEAAQTQVIIDLHNKKLAEHLNSKRSSINQNIINSHYWQLMAEHVPTTTVTKETPSSDIKNGESTENKIADKMLPIRKLGRKRISDYDAAYKEMEDKNLSYSEAYKWMEKEFPPNMDAEEDIRKKDIKATSPEDLFKSAMNYRKRRKSAK